MKIKFEATQTYQLKAIQAVVDVFDGQRLLANAAPNLQIGAIHEGGTGPISGRNLLLLDEESILKNVRLVQTKNGLPESSSLVPSVAEDQKTVFSRLNFTIEMETGTGKTYTYLRTIYELNQKYGFTKFVVVVPSVAIREGVQKQLEMTHSHLQALYGHPPVQFSSFTRGKTSNLRTFAANSFMTVLILNIDAFAKDTNIINTQTETGVAPIAHIQQTHPIVIIDEPQNFETDIRRKAIANLNPLCTLRYSATHRKFYNLLYSLGPAIAYDLGLVKQIQVDGITSTSQAANSSVLLKKIIRGKEQLRAKLQILVQTKEKTASKVVLANVGDDLHAISKHNAYHSGLRIETIDAQKEFVAFSNGQRVYLHSKKSESHDQMLKYQIERTIYWHFERLATLKAKAIKVLSLFFIDRVANYKAYTAQGDVQKGKFAVWFEEIFTQYQHKYPSLVPFTASQVHGGYFSTDKRKKTKDGAAIWVDSKEKPSLNDEDTYALIMRDKERLLGLEEPLQFLFSHTALREGWDNPNVFQICTLNETKSELKKRQEIGRGLRLPVNTNGNRVVDKKINVLTVIANESYEAFSNALQQEIMEETSVQFEGRIKNAQIKSGQTSPKPQHIEDITWFHRYWRAAMSNTSYFFPFASENLIAHTVAAMGNNPPEPKPGLQSRVSALSFSKKGITNALLAETHQTLSAENPAIPPVFSYLQQYVQLSKESILRILQEVDRMEELMANPYAFLDRLVVAIKSALQHLLTGGILLEHRQGGSYRMQLCEPTAFQMSIGEAYLQKFPAGHKTDFLPVFEDVSQKTLQPGQAATLLHFPKSFAVETPLGDYWPDWGVVFDQGQKIFLVENKRCQPIQLPAKAEKDKQQADKLTLALFYP